jgi:hypothetical protein
MTNAIKMLLQMQSGFLQLESTLDTSNTFDLVVTAIVLLVAAK